MCLISLILNNIDVFPVVMLLPDFCEGPSVYQLRIDSDAVSGFLDATFQHIRNTQRSSDLAFILLFPAISRHAAAADYLERRHIRQTRQDRVLNAIGEVAVFVICGQAIEWQYRDACFIAGWRTAPGSEKRNTAQVRSEYRAKTEPDQAKDRDNRSNLNAPVVKQSGLHSVTSPVAPRVDRLSSKMASDIVRKLCDRRIPQAWFLLQRTNQNRI